MKLVVKSLAGQDAEIVCVVGDLVSVHHSAGHLDGAHEIEVVVAQVVRELFNKALVHQSGVLDDEVVNGQGGCDGCFVCDHVKVKGAIAVSGRVLDNTRINDGARGRIGVRVSLFLDESGVDPLVNEAVQDLGVVVSLDTFDRCFNRGFLISDHLLLVAGAADTIPVDSDLGWQSLIDFRVLNQGLLQESRDDGSSVGTHALFLLLL